MEERKLTEKESIEIISSMISRTKQRYIGDGNIMLMWGYLSVGVAALVWIMLALTRNPSWNWLWFLIWIIGGMLTPVMARRQESEKMVKTYSDKVTSQIWSVVGYSAIVMTVCCLGLMLIKGVDTWMAWFAFALIIVPFAEISQGVVLKEKCLVAGGASALVIGIFTLCCIVGGVKLVAYWFLPLFMLAFICMMVIPGHILNHKAKARK